MPFGSASANTTAVLLAPTSLLRNGKAYRTTIINGSASLAFVGPSTSAADGYGMTIPANSSVEILWDGTQALYVATPAAQTVPNISYWATAESTI